MGNKDVVKVRWSICPPTRQSKFGGDVMFDREDWDSMDDHQRREAVLEAMTDGSLDWDYEEISE